MGRWNHNGAWREFGRWCAAAGMGLFIVFSIYAFFLLAGPFAEAVIKYNEGWVSHEMVAWIFRILIILNAIAIIWLFLRAIEKQDGEWPE